MEKILNDMDLISASEEIYCLDPRLKRAGMTNGK
jgi:hypothetical protein